MRLERLELDVEAQCRRVCRREDSSNNNILMTARVIELINCLSVLYYLFQKFIVCCLLHIIRHTKRIGKSLFNGPVPSRVAC